MSSIIFDFDGTIADSFKMFVDILYELTGTTEKVPDEEITRLRGMSPWHVAAELKIRPWKVPILVLRGRPRVRAGMKYVQPFEGMAEVIENLYHDGHDLYIMSSNSVQNIQPFLEKYRMSTEFIKIYGNVGIFAKARVLKRLIRQNNLDTKTAYYVGDEVRDVVAAKRAGVKMVAVTWGYNTPKILEAHQPECIARKPTDILNIFKQVIIKPKASK